MGFFLGLYLVHGFRWVLIFIPIWWPLSLEIWSTPLAVDTWSQERGYELTLMVSNLWHQGKANFSPWSNLQMTNFPTFQRRYDGKHPFPRHLNHCAFHLHGCIFGCLQHAWVWRSHYLGPLFPEKLTCTGMKENNIMKKIYNQQVEPYVVTTLSVTWDKCEGAVTSNCSYLSLTIKGNPLNVWPFKLTLSPLWWTWLCIYPREVK